MVRCAVAVRSIGGPVGSKDYIASRRPQVIAKSNMYLTVRKLPYCASKSSGATLMGLRPIKVRVPLPFLYVAFEFHPSVVE
jgi:hypothetical protein